MYSRMKKLAATRVWKLMECVLVAAAICIFLNLRTSNFIYIMAGGLYAVVSQQRILLEKREKIVRIILSTFFALCMVMGNIEAILDSELIIPWVLRAVICLAGFYLCFSLLLEQLLAFFRKARVCDSDVERTDKQKWICFGISFAALMVAGVIGLAISYPANTTADSNDIIRMALGEKKMIAAVPPVYILIIRFLWNVGSALFGTYNASLAVCAFAHVLLLALIVSYFIALLYKYNVNKIVCIVVGLFYTVIPYNVQLAHTLWKDIPFSAFTFLLVILIWEQCNGNTGSSKAAEYGKMLLIIIAATGMCLMRSNGMFAFIFFLPFGLCAFFKNNKRLFVSLILAFILVRVIQGPVYNKIMTDNNAAVEQKKATEEGKDLTEIKPVKQVKNAADTYNSSGVFIVTIQQLARIAVDRQDLPPEDYERLNKIFDVEKVREVYDPYLMDPVGKIRNYKMSTGEYLKEWLYFGCKYPVQFFLGWKDQTFGYWYPDVQHWVYTDQIRDSELDLYKDSILPDEIRRIWLRAEELYKDIPVYGMLWSIGFAVWVTFLFMGVTYIKKGMKALLPYIPVIGVWATLLVATPVYAEFRYIYPVFLCLPLSVLLPFVKVNDNKNK